MVLRQKQNICPANFMINVYLLKSIKDGNYYVGIAKNIKERLKKHNSGEVMSTKNRCP